MWKADKTGEIMEPEECSPFFYRCRLKASAENEGIIENEQPVPAEQRCREDPGCEWVADPAAPEHGVR
jgi:hypothetical protein